LGRPDASDHPARCAAPRARCQGWWPFAGYEHAGPVPRPACLTEAQLERAAIAGAVSTFSHMARVRLAGAPARPAAPRAPWCPGDIAGLKPQRTPLHACSPNDAGGILDDLMVTNARATTCSWSSTPPASRADIAHLQQHLAKACAVEPLPDRALLALQGAGGRAAVHGPAGRPIAAALGFMHFCARCAFARAAVLGQRARGLHRRRTGSRSRSPAADGGNARRAPCWRMRGSSRSGWAARRRFAPARGRPCACTATTSTRPRRRSRPTSPGRSQKAPPRGRPGFFGADKILRQLARGAPPAQAGVRPQARRQRRRPGAKPHPR